MKYCDLHCHSLFSDGSCSPEELVDMAISSGLSAIALTDHNTMAGIKSFYRAAAGKIEACGGCEITTGVDGQELHLLGMFLNPETAEPIQKKLDEQVENKKKSNQTTIDNLQSAGYPVSYDEFLEEFGDGVKNRVHIAKYLIEKGSIKDTKEAFEGLLSANKGYYKETKKLDFFEMIGLIKEAGGISVWAHPLLHVDRETFEKIIPRAKGCGLDGAEVYYSTYTEDDTVFMQQMCKKYQFLESGGSDFHGENNPGVSLGTGCGNLRVPYSCYEELKKAAFK